MASNNNDEDDPFKRSFSTQRSPPLKDEESVIDETKEIENEEEKNLKEQKLQEEKRKKTERIIEEKRKLISSSTVNQSQTGTNQKMFPCAACDKDTKNFRYIACDKCNSATHIECVLYDRFGSKGSYRCVNCQPHKKHANANIYCPLTSELIYFIANHEIDLIDPIPYGDFVHASCKVSKWPQDDNIFALAYQVNDEEGQTLICLACNKNIPSDSTLVCKGCLTLTHSECCHDENEREKECTMCFLLHTQDESHTSGLIAKTSQRPMRERKCTVETKIESNVNKNERIINNPNRSQVNDPNDSSSDESDDENSLAQRVSNVFTAPRVSESRMIRDQLHKMQLNQILHKNLPPLIEFAQWESFYRAYEETKNEFSASQNVERLKNAIKCTAVKTWGKARLFELETYDDRIQYINSTYNIPSVVLQLELNKLTQRKRIASYERAKLAEFINDVEDFCVLQRKKGTEASRRDENMLRSIIEVLPKEMGEAYVNYVHNKATRVLCIDTLNKFLQNKMYGLIFNNPEIITISDNASSSKRFNDNQHFQKQKGRFGSFNSHNNESSIGCTFCNDKRHTFLNCYKAWNLSGYELSKRLKEKNLCIMCGQEPFSGKGHRCTKPSNKFCTRPQHKEVKHYEILCSLREASKPQNNFQRETNNVSQYSNRNANSNSRGRGRGNGHSQRNNSRQTNPSQSFLNQNNQNSTQVTQHVAPSINNNNSQMPMNAQSNLNNNVDQNFLTFTGSYFNLNKAEQAQWKTSETLLPVIVLKLGKQKNPVSFLLDSGSAISLIETYVADYFQEQGQALPIRLNWSGDATYYNRSDTNSRVVCLEAEACNNNGTKRLMHFHTFKNLSIAPQTLDVAEVKARYQHLKDLSLTGYKKIHGVIGQDQVNLFKVLKQCSSSESNEDCYLGYETPMGDFVSGTRFSIASLYKKLTIRNQQNTNGAINNFMASTNMNTQACVDINELKMLEERLMGEEYFEEPPVNDRVCADEEYALSVLEREMYQDENGKFVSPLIFKDPNPKLPAVESYCMAKKRHYALTTMLTKHGKFDEVNEEINKMISKGYCEKVLKKELHSYDMTYYLPIFCISPPNKRTRVIWDGRATCSTGESLNSLLLPGPNLYNNLLQIYLNMRSEKFLIVGDLEEMFHQIVIKPEHRNALRFLWADELNKEPEIYRMTRLVFGLNCAPFIAQFAVKLTAKSIVKIFPQIAKILDLDIYMDDIVTSLNDFVMGQQLVVALKQCLSESGFNLVKLKSSHPKIFDKLKEMLSPEELSHEKLFPEGSMHRVLGYLNDFNDDTFSLGINYEKYEKFLNEEIYPTKRDVLSLSRSIYDPLGLFAFLTSNFKFIYHLICNEQLDWEDPIPHEVYKLWKQALKALPECCKIKLPRCYVQAVNNTQIKQLWAFSDASDHAGCVSIYYRIINSDRSQVDVVLVMAKDFVVSNKVKRTIPELELDAATRAVLLLKEVIKLHTKIEFDEIYLVVDNSSVFNWLIYGVEKPTVYVKNRLKKIQEAKLKINYKWVSTEYQAADYGTKFSSMPELTSTNEWFYPKLFRMAEEDWISDQFLRKSENNVMTIQKGQNVEWERFSTLNRLIECIRKVFRNLSIKIRERKLKNLRDINENAIQTTRRERKINNIKYDKMGEEIKELFSDPTFKREEVKKLIIMKVQTESFAEELKVVTKGDQLSLNHALGKLLLCVKDGLLCNTSRLPENILKEMRFKEFKKYTIVLPKNNHVTKLIIMQAHIDNKHFHIDSTIAMLTKSYYIPQIRSTVIKTIRENCYLCRKLNRRPHAPLCGDLPIEKLCVDHSPFSNVIIDMAGPYMIKTQRTRSEATLKRYLLVVVCLTTRAMHIEIMYDASSDSFIKALIITFELRGYPRKIICDRGTNFVGANNSLKKLMNDYNKQRLLIVLSPVEFQFEFRFNSAKSPHMQGSVERLIGNVKVAMNKMRKFVSEWSENLDDATFRFVITCIIGMMNNRPLCAIQIKGTTSYLTPNSFIMNRENNALCPPIDPPGKYDDLWSRYLDIQKILWEHFVDHCVPQWVTREKWLRPTKNFTIGEIVLTLDHKKTNDWRLARIIEIENGSNNQVRKLTLMLGKRNQNKVPKLQGNDFEAFAKALYENGKCYKVTRAAAHVIKLDLYCEEALRIPIASKLEELEEED